MRDRNSSSPATHLTVRGASIHNLKDVDCQIPHGALTVVTGLSGAGKSSLAVDTIYAEAQRRFVESMSTYARQFLRQMERPPVDSIDGVLPPLALTPKVSIRAARQTVGTLSEVWDLLRLLYSALGEVDCASGHGPLRSWTAAEFVEVLRGGVAGERFTLCAEVERPAIDPDRALAELVRLGHRRAWRDGEVIELQASSSWGESPTVLLVVARLASSADAERIQDAVTQAIDLGGGTLRVFGEQELSFQAGAEQLYCMHCLATSPRPSADLFSFYSPLGACTECNGFGRVQGIDRNLVIPDPGRNLAENPFAPWWTPRHSRNHAKLMKAAEEAGIPTEVAWRDLSAEQQEWAWSGSAVKGGAGFVSLDRFFERLERKSYRVHARVFLARFRSYDSCPECSGERLSPPGRRFSVDGERLPELARLSLEGLLAWVEERAWTDRERDLVGKLVDDLQHRLQTLVRVGLGYLSLDRRARTLSGGEIQRVQLAAALGSGLTSTLYVIDEPTVGLHAGDSQRLLEILRQLAGQGNTVLVVEHDPALILGADHVIDLGPGSGESGGCVLAAGTVDEILSTPDSVTGRLLARGNSAEWREHSSRFHRESGVRRRRQSRRASGEIVVRGARAHNLQDLTVCFPVGRLSGVAGASGSGKSTLVADTLHRYVAGRFATGQVAGEVGGVGNCDGVEGLDLIAGVELVDQSPVGRSSRSNPVTYVKAFDGIRKLFAGTRQAQALGLGPGAFSFNVDGGRCPECKGSGDIEVDMQFMAPITVICEACSGTRYQRQILDVRWRGRNIAEVLRMTVDEALKVFSDAQAVSHRLHLLEAAGLGYLRLGQSTATLSGGEAQRLKLASLLDPRNDEPRLLLFDEPTTGLHLADIDVLVATLRRLAERGHTVIVVEHSLEFLERVDWLVDLGPGGGPHGGRLLYQGPVDQYLDSAQSPTADLMRERLEAPPVTVVAGG